MGESSNTTDARRPSPTSPSRMEQALERAAGAAPRRGATSTSATGEPLDWIAFRGRFFPGSVRHHLAALHAYGAYRASTRVERASGSAGLANWENEGGASPSAARPSGQPVNHGR